MTDLEHILPLWHQLEASRGNYVLATVVAVEGPSYRKPGARMLLAQDGRRAGTVSGGCLEAEVARRAWWHTESEPVESAIPPPKKMATCRTGQVAAAWYICCLNGARRLLRC